MLFITFPNGKKVRAIILDTPISGVSGIAECCHCDWRCAILAKDTEEIAKEIETFANKHFCGRKPNELSPDLIGLRKLLLDKFIKVRRL